MQVSVESGEGLEKRLLVDLSADRVNAEVDKKLKDLARHVRLDGFRPGKVPMRTLKQRFGEQVRQETYGALVQETLYEAASQEKLAMAGEPRIEVREAAEEGGFGYTATFEVLPEIALADLSDQRVAKPSAEVTDADIDDMLDKLRRQRTTWEVVERAAQDGDKLQLDFVGKLDGEAFEGGTGEDVPLVLGSGSMIEGFETGLLGVSTGDERTLELRFPDDYGAAHLAGKDVVFDVKVRQVEEPVLPEIDEDFVQAFGVADGTVESLRNDVASNMRRELKQRLSGITKDRVMDVLIAANPIDLPKSMVMQEAERMKQQMLAEMQQKGQGAGMELPASMFEAQAQRRVHLGLLVGEIINREGLKAEDPQVRDMIAEFADSYEDPQEVVDYYLRDPKARGSVENLVLENAVVDWILGQVVVDDDAKSFAELMENKA